MPFQTDRNHYVVLHKLSNTLIYYTVKCLKRPLKKKIVFKADYRLMQVGSIAECCILQYFRPSLKGTATLIISMFYQKELYEPCLLIQVSSKSVEK